MARVLILCTLVLTLASCASSSGPAKPQRSEFEDVPVPSGLTLDSSRTTIIESPTLKAARLFYKSRIKPESLAVAYRTSLEANGWRHISSTTSAGKGATQSAYAPVPARDASVDDRVTAVEGRLGEMNQRLDQVGGQVKCFKDGVATAHGRA